jgi:large subunit ribosomal protein L30e
LISDRELGKILIKAVRTGKCVLGAKEVLKALKGVKLVVYSAALPEAQRQRLVDACKAASIPVLAYPGSSNRLGELCGRPFRVSVVAVKSPGEADLTPLLSQVKA